MNLIRKILVKDFKNCDNFTDVCVGYDNNSWNVHERSCSDKSTSPIPANSILSSILGVQLLVKKNFAKLESSESLEKLIDCDVAIQEILQDYKMGSTALDCSIMLTLRRINGKPDLR